MSVSLSVNGVVYAYPITGEYNWGAATTAWAQAVTAGMLQKAGGSFTLTAETDFGSSYGLKSTYFKSRAANPASAGQVRLGNTEGIQWRNAANSGDIALVVNASNALLYNSNELADFGTVSKTEFGYLSGVTSSIQSQIGAKLTDPMTTRGDLLYRDGSGAQRLAVGTSGQLLKSDGTDPVWGRADPNVQSVALGAADFTVTATYNTFETPTGMSLTITSRGTSDIFLVTYTGRAEMSSSPAAAASLFLGYQIDSGTPVGLTSFSYNAAAATDTYNANFSTIITSLAAGSYTLNLQVCKVGTGTVKLSQPGQHSEAKFRAIRLSLG